MVAFRSREYLHQNPVARWLLVGAVLLCGVAFAAGGMGEEPGESAAAWATGAVVVAAMIALFWMPLTITVETTHVRVSFAGVVNKVIALDDITAVEQRAYRPLKDFGGWGWRWSHRLPNAVAYTTRGTTAVVLTVRDGGQVYLGVDDEAALLEALSGRMGA